MSTSIQQIKDLYYETSRSGTRLSTGHTTKRLAIGAMKVRIAKQQKQHARSIADRDQSLSLQRAQLIGSYGDITKDPTATPEGEKPRSVRTRA